MSNYEKKYKEALARAKTLIEKLESNHIKGFIYDIFPELKESDDERIRKGIIRNLEYLMDRAEGFVKDELKERIAWLEKQKEFVSADFDDVWETADCEELTAPLDKYSKDAIKKMCHAWYDKGIELERRNWLEKQGVQPRYNIGDIICDKSCTTLNKEAQPNMEIVDIKNGMYICDKGSFPVSQQDEYELVSKKIDTKLNDDSVSNELRAASVKHAEKELKNHTFPNNEEFELVYTFEEGAKWKAAQKPTAWSEEDENIKQWIISDIDKLFCLNKKSSSLVGKEIEWLKSLKERVQLQSKQEWSEEDEGILDEIIDFLENGTVKLQHDLSLYASWLKSLKDRYAWKPSWEQLDALEYHLKHTNENSRLYKETKELYDQLKKL